MKVSTSSKTSSIEKVPSSDKSRRRSRNATLLLEPETKKKQSHRRFSPCKSCLDPYLKFLFCVPGGDMIWSESLLEVEFTLTCENQGWVGTGRGKVHHLQNSRQFRTRTCYCSLHQRVLKMKIGEIGQYANRTCSVKSIDLGYRGWGICPATIQNNPLCSTVLPNTSSQTILRCTTETYCLGGF